MPDPRYAKFDMLKLDRAFKETETYKTIVEIAIGVMNPLVTGGLKQRYAQRKGEWRKLSPRYVARKVRQGYSAEPWVRTGRTFKAIDNNPISKEGTKLGLQFKIVGTRTAPRARIVPKTLGKHLQKKPSGRYYNRVLSLVDVRRQFFRWKRADIPELEKNVARVLSAAFKKRGLYRGTK